MRRPVWLELQVKEAWQIRLEKKEQSGSGARDQISARRRRARGLSDVTALVFTLREPESYWRVIIRRSNLITPVVC